MCARIFSLNTSLQIINIYQFICFWQGNDSHICCSWKNFSLCWWTLAIQVFSLFPWFIYKLCGITWSYWKREHQAIWWILCGLQTSLKMTHNVVFPLSSAFFLIIKTQLSLWPIKRSCIIIQYQISLEHNFNHLPKEKSIDCFVMQRCL